MEMWTDMAQLRQAFRKFPRDNTRLKRPQPKPLHTVYSVNCLCQREQIFLLPLKIHAIRADMDACQHELLISCPDKPFYFLNDI